MPTPPPSESEVLAESDAVADSEGAPVEAVPADAEAALSEAALADAEAALSETTLADALAIAEAALSDAEALSDAARSKAALSKVALSDAEAVSEAALAVVKAVLAKAPEDLSDVEADAPRLRHRPLTDAEAEAEADAVLFQAEAEPPEADTLIFEAESALFLAEVALSEAEAELVAAAWEVREHAVCRYSGFAVGAALLDSHGRQFTGANVENASYNLGLCAERVALYHALTHGAGRFVAVAIVTEAPVPTTPCGACRQALWEFAPHAEILLVSRHGHQRMTVRDLLPHAFDDATLRAARTDDEPPR